jgi:hypothetical protein
MSNNANQRFEEDRKSQRLTTQRRYEGIQSHVDRAYLERTVQKLSNRIKILERGTSAVGYTKGKASVTISQGSGHETNIQNPHHVNRDQLALASSDAPTFSGLTLLGEQRFEDSQTINVYNDAAHTLLTIANTDATYQANVSIEGTLAILAGISGDLNLNNGELNNVEAINFNLTPTVTDSEGYLWWNSTDKTLNLRTDTESVLQIGQESYMRVLNNSGGTLTNGQIVYISGASTGRPTVSLADASIHDKINHSLAIVTADILNATEGFVTRFGLVRNLNTSGISAGAHIYLSDTTPGAFTDSRPMPPSFPVEIGHVIDVHATTGSILFDPRGFGDESFFNGTFLESVDALVTSDGVTITMSLEKEGTGDLTMRFSDGFSTLDCTPAQTIALTAGTIAAPQENFIYIPKTTKVLTKSTTGFPGTEHIKVGYFLVQTAVYVQSYGALVNQNWNDHSVDGNGQGHMSHIAERMRRSGALYFSGINANGATSSYFTIGVGSVTWQSTAGVVSQMHKHTVPAIDTSTTGYFHVVNDFTTPYVVGQDLYTAIPNDSTGTALGNNRYFAIIVWGVANKSGEYEPLMISLPAGTYTSAADAENDVDGYDNWGFARYFNIESSTGYYICRVVFQKTATSWVWQTTQDLRGISPFTTGAAGGTGGAVTPLTDFSDASFTWFNATDATKIVDVDLSGLTTASIRTLTMPDNDITIAGIDYAQTWSAIQTFGDDIKLQFGILPDVYLRWDNTNSIFDINVAGYIDMELTQTLRVRDVDDGNRVLFEFDTNSGQRALILGETSHGVDLHFDSVAGRIALGTSILTRAAFDFKPTITDTAVLTYGIVNDVTSSGATPTSHHNLYSAWTFNGTSVTDMWNIRIKDTTGTGVINSQYGLYIDALTKGSTNYAIYSAGGNVFIGAGQTTFDYDSGVPLIFKGNTQYVGGEYYSKTDVASAYVGVDNTLNYLRLNAINSYKLGLYTAGTLALDISTAQVIDLPQAKLTIAGSGGTAGYHLQTDGAGNISWGAAGAGGDDLGNHTATEALKLGAFGITSNDGDGVSFYFGRSAIYNAGTDVAYWAHRDQATASDYAIKQTASGFTEINAGLGANIKFRIDADASEMVTTGLTYWYHYTDTFILSDSKKLYLGAGGSADYGIYWDGSFARHQVGGTSVLSIAGSEVNVAQIFKPTTGGSIDLGTTTQYFQNAFVEGVFVYPNGTAPTAVQHAWRIAEHNAADKLIFQYGTVTPAWSTAFAFTQTPALEIGSASYGTNSIVFANGEGIDNDSDGYLDVNATYLRLQTTHLFTSSGTLILNSYGSSADTTIQLYNSDGTYKANLSVEGETTTAGINSTWFNDATEVSLRVGDTQKVGISSTLMDIEVDVVISSGSSLLVSGAESSFTGTATEEAEGAGITQDEIRLGIVGALPRIQLIDDGSDTNWQIDNSAGTLRFFKPGTVYAQLNTSSFSVAADILPTTTNTRDVGSASLKFAEIHGTDVYAGDLIWQETKDYFTEEPFVEGDLLVLVVTGFAKDGSTRTVPVKLDNYVKRKRKWRL